MAVVILDALGTIIGAGSVLALVFLYRHCDSFADGNVGADE